ncbi:MAG: Wzz/FepE/Etk N-terminal domain-containing protein, partial [Thermodesulfovibrionales bacterium]
MMIDDMNGREKQSRREIQRVEDYPLASPMDYHYQEEEPHLRDYLSVLMRRKWIALVFFVVVVTSVTIGTFLVKPVYRSTITLKVDKETPNIFQEKSTPMLILMNENDFETQKRTLQSRSLAVHAIRSMGLADNPELTGKKSGPRQPAGAGNEEAAIDNGVIASFLSRITVQPVSDSRLIQVSFDSTSPQLSASVANGIGKAFMEHTMKSKFDATQQARDWLEKQMEEMRAKVERAEEALNRYAA